MEATQYDVKLIVVNQLMVEGGEILETANQIGMYLDGLISNYERYNQ